MKPESIPEVRQSAEQTFSVGLGCAESVVLAIANAQGIESELLPKLATAFCGGMARTRGPCGALSGALMGVGLTLGRSQPDESVDRPYAAAQRLIGEFESAFGARDCQTLLGGCDLGTEEGRAVFKEQHLRERCLQFTGAAAEMAARAIVESAA